ncbi:precorrin-2 dehydrogenase/sirohydrochlorin ferrochelatase family protein [Eubacterium pyruvativorans]|uniref:precorrin-2 dehydrogenase/sirohydrochlorin ferrochelatase family protein n=1 Tax=Eubacterium pyruvativorans TaxID=155865 RepID=UPI000885DCA6|nr:bifunctional precorrin-2 dehydrogenase/sirohydrochlorin ferrochelatase [Eubacterium pyruvativorans]SDF44750.1 precorrin-2 dehydrogenase / sirohydrochlorin ferrochelatase [Eubacterium pyruvativorans]
MAYFPFMIEVENARILIAGGGRSALWKVKALSGFGADLVVAAPSVLPELRERERAGEIRILLQPYRPDLLEDTVFVVAATGDPEKNRSIAADCGARGIPCNAVDDPAHSDFIFPAVLRRENYTLAVSTDGKSPLMARKIKERAAEALPEEFDRATGALGDMRARVLREEKDPGKRMRIFEAAAQRLLAGECSGADAGEGSRTDAGEKAENTAAKDK